jgi:glycosyltransferase involved in cell wall biosynthesis
MTMPTVSVVIPAYNHEQFIGAAIDSVLGQTMQDLELVIVDDGSTDRTAEVIKAYDDPRLSYTWQQNQDAFNTINRGMSMAKGRYIAILNSDDIFTLDRLERLLAHSVEHQSDCIITDVIPISDEGVTFEDPGFGWNQWHQRNRHFYFAQQDLYSGFLQGNLMVTTSNLFMTRAAADKVGQFSTLRYLHDYDYIFRMMLAHPESVHYLDQEKLLYYRIHQGNTLSEAAITGRQQDLEVIRKYMLAKIPERYRGYAAAGSDRLRALENELHEVRAELSQMEQGAEARSPGHRAKWLPSGARRLAGATLRKLGLR